MRMVICAVRDAKAEVFMQPMFFQAPAQARRAFGDAVNDPKTDFGRHPEDYTLFALGEWDEFEGKIEMYPQAVSLAVGSSLVQQEGDGLRLAR